jgi:7-carboxy-7-deazaguanine synthase
MKVKTKTTLRINEIFYSLQGEALTSGLPTTFIRLTGCPLRCQYCDTAYAFHQGKTIPLENIIQKVQSYPTSWVTVTGGEPLAQLSCLTLLKKLCDLGYKVSLETSGALDISNVDPRVSRVLDIKTPGSKESHRNLWSNLPLLQSQDQIKFVICDYNDYLWSKKCILQPDFPQHCPIFFSASANQLSPSNLANWILSDHLQVRLQIQLHKVLWGDTPGR